VALQGMKTELIEFMLSKAKSWPRHVLELNTVSICKLLPLKLQAMPAFLDSRLFPPMEWPGEQIPKNTLALVELKSSSDYFDPLGISGSKASSMSNVAYIQSGLVVEDYTNLVQVQTTEEELKMRDKAPLRSCFRDIVTGKIWTFFIIVIVMVDLCMMTLEIADVIHEGFLMETCKWLFLAIFLLDVVLRVLLDGQRFFFGDNRYMNVFEAMVIIICSLLQVADSELNLSFMRALRPGLRAVRFVRLVVRVFFVIIKDRKTNFKSKLPL